MTEPTETERREMNARLARAMGWDFIPHPSEAVNALEPDRGEWYTPKGRLYGDEPPDFTRDYAASRELVLWLVYDERAPRAERLKRSYKFCEVLVSGILGEGRLEICDWEESVLAALTTDLLLIAQAADAAIGGNDER